MRFGVIICFCLVMSGCDTAHDLEGEPVDALTSSPETSEPEHSEPENEPSDGSDVVDEPVDPWQRVRDRISFSTIQSLSFAVGTADGVVFTHHKGESTATTAYSSASAIKWVTAAVILRLVEEGLLGLDNHPQDYLAWWTDDPEDERSRVTVRQLLSFTSGLSGTPFGDNTPRCLEDESTTIALCAQQIYESAFSYVPGEAYFYGPSHMQVLAAIAEAASGESWADLYSSRVAEPVGMINTEYNWPSTENPRISGGAQTTMQDFQRFAESMLTNAYWPTTWSEMLIDHTASPGVTFEYSPMTNGSRGWHYGLGVWLECLNPQWDETCERVDVISASGLFGFHLWLDLARGHYAVLAMEDSFSGWSTSIQLSILLREDVAAAVASGETQP
ncbi:MAG: beta-lactamase family protein [Deltaproteobacteria bacterium]|nr:beta-lactamase family protein [Deltaproteobacteria bacterium]